MAGLALNLRQLAMAGEEFWVTSAVPAPDSPAQDGLAWGTLEPDESIELAEAELPDWLSELPVEEAPPEVRATVYPLLVPIEGKSRESRRHPLLMLVMALLGLLLIGLIALVVYLVLYGGF
jgi:hypothetical protein